MVRASILNTIIFSPLYLDAEEIPPSIAAIGGRTTYKNIQKPYQLSVQSGAPTINTNQPSSKRLKKQTYTAGRRCSSSVGNVKIGGADCLLGGLNLQLPQLDAIQRMQRILDMRLQNLQVCIIKISVNFMPD
ncbi:unnamed protein product [Schistosoma curassoni]|uniref:Uncharacterized protein n=1 Tax=Schistosoma curassoni TaxID=6186 RepID=A0A3P8FUC3_9TREM|nr:unnamed protein product [Schistosoma curassoni]